LGGTSEVGTLLLTFARENRSRRKLHARKEKGSEEEKETLKTVSEM
jgi:hypothetical protein